MNSEKVANDSYYYEDRTGTASITLDKDVECGLMDSWNGKGSLFGIKLICDVELPVKAIFKMVPDRLNGGYGFMEIYGHDESIFREAVKSINVPKVQTLDSVIKSATEKSQFTKPEGTQGLDELTL